MSRNDAIHEEERNAIVAVMLEKFEKFKVRYGWSLLDENVRDYMNMSDILDALVSVFGSYQSIYDIATLRNTLEEKMEEVDAEENK